MKAYQEIFQGSAFDVPQKFKTPVALRGNGIYIQRPYKELFLVIKGRRR
jgi:hypothetical protein